MDSQTDGTAVATTEDIQSVCLERTAAALYESGAATESEIQAAAHICYRKLDAGEDSDLLECVARAQGNDDAKLPDAIRALAARACRTTVNPPMLIPFADKLIVPNTFYSTYPEIHTICKALLSPLLYAEDTDAIGVASINPVACTLAAEHIIRIAHTRTGIRPFVTTALVNYEAWAKLNRKHFKR